MAALMGSKVVTAVPELDFVVGKDKVLTTRYPKQKELQMVQQVVCKLLKGQASVEKSRKVLQDISCVFDRNASAEKSKGSSDENFAKLINTISSVYKGSGMAWDKWVQRYEQQTNDTVPVILTDAEKDEYFSKQFPLENDVAVAAEEEETESETKRVTNPHSFEIDKETLQNVVAVTAGGKAMGPDNLGSSHFRHLILHAEAYAGTIASVYQDFILHPENMVQSPELFRFKVSWIPKKNGKFRGISVHNQHLIAAHRVLAQQLKSVVKINKQQFAFKSCGRNIAIFHALKFKANKGMKLIQLDVKNAFGSVSHKVLKKALKKQGLDPQITAYIMNFLKLRKEENHQEYGDFNCGVAQGCPLSMLLFCIVMEDVIKELQAIYGVENVIVYADDLSIAVKMEQSTEEVIAKATEIMAKVGLKVAPEKCKASDEHDLDFLGALIPMNPEDARTVVDGLLEEAKNYSKVMESN